MAIKRWKNIQDKRSKRINNAEQKPPQYLTSPYRTSYSYNADAQVAQETFHPDTLQPLGTLMTTCKLAVTQVHVVNNVAW